MTGIHNWPHFHHNPDALYSRLIYAAKSGDVAHVICHGRWLMRERRLLTIDEARVKEEAAAVATQIDAFVVKREASPYNKLVILAGVQRLESFEVQVKAHVTAQDHIVTTLGQEPIEIVREARYRQFDNYLIFSGEDPYAARLRYREEEFINEQGEVGQVRSRLTLLSEAHPQEFVNAVLLSRSRYLAPAEQSLRFYREYFSPTDEVEVHKMRRRWRILYRETDFAVNLDQMIKPELPGYYLEIKSRTWSREDARRKAELILELLDLLRIDLTAVERKEYVELAQAET
jgi:5-methylthioadenosine/S-adenosylhomocysteine deaminase